MKIICQKSNLLKSVSISLKAVPSKTTMPILECILIDDGSTDASGEICDKVACIDKRFEVIHIPNSGVSHARNVGIDASCGEYITFIDSDDRIPNNYLENLYETIIERSVDFLI